MRAACLPSAGSGRPLYTGRRAQRPRRPVVAAALDGSDLVDGAASLALPDPAALLALPGIGSTASLALAGLGGLAAIAAASAALAAAASGRVDFATTARLEAVVRPGAGPRAVLLLAPPDKGATRGLFLLPDRVTSATVVGPGLDEEWWAKAGAQAGVAVRTLGSLEALAGLPAASFDAALVRGDVLGAVSAADPSGRARTTVLRSIARALAPGAAAVIAERLAGGGLGAGLARAAARAPGPGVAQADLEALLEGVTERGGPVGGKVKASAPAGFARVALDVVAGGLDPTALVVAATPPSTSGGVRAPPPPLPPPLPPPPAQEQPAAVEGEAPAIEGRVRGGGSRKKKGGKAGGFGG